MTLNFWDHWCLLAIREKFSGDLEVRVRGFGGVSVLNMVPERLIKKEMPKAKSQILKASCTHSPSIEMLNAPYRMLRKEAYRDQWKDLPVNPVQYEPQFVSLFTPKAKFGYIPKGATFKLAKRLEKKIAGMILTGIWAIWAGLG